MPQATREIKRRIRSIKNTRQITKAMELVSAAKMRKSVQNVLATRTYAQLGWQLLRQLKERTDSSHHPLLAERSEVKRVGIVVVSSNRGLCGGFNQQLANTVLRLVQTEKSANAEVEVVALGRRGRDAVYRGGVKIVAEFIKADVTKSSEDIMPIAKLILDDYLSGKYDKVVVAYTDFVSPISQKPRIKQLLPIVNGVDAELGSARAQGTQAAQEIVEKVSYPYEYLFEPDPAQVLASLLPRLIEVQLYQAVLESDASEHSARMLAMRNASDAAKDMIDALTLSFNQARQAGITAELAEIVSGSVAVSG